MHHKHGSILFTSDDACPIIMGARNETRFCKAFQSGP